MYTLEDIARQSIASQTNKTLEHWLTLKLADVQAWERTLIIEELARRDSYAEAANAPAQKVADSSN